MDSSQNEIPCTRYDEPSRSDNRVRETLAYASGAAGRPITADEVISLHDYKGCLVVVWASQEAFDNLAHSIENAWQRWGNEGFLEHRLATVVTIADYADGTRRAVT